MPPKPLTEKQTMAVQTRMESLLKELSLYQKEYSEFVITDQGTYECLSVIRSEIIELKNNYKELYSQLPAEHIDESTHFQAMQLFAKFQGDTNSKLRTFEEKQCREREQDRPPIVPAVTASSVALPLPPSQQNFRLPEIPLPTFGGDFSSWLDFSTVFTNIIVDNESVSEHLKFYYLKQSLYGQALARIQNIPPGKGDFKLAWDSLTQRYHNPRLIASSHILALENTPKIVRNDSQSLRAFIDHTKSHINALEALKLGIELKDLLFLHKILAQLDQSCLRAWESRCTIDQIPTLDELFEFLETQCKVYDALGSNNSQPAPQKINQKPHFNASNQYNNQPQNKSYNQRPNNNQQSNRYSFPPPQANTFNQSMMCNFCREKTHYTFKCNSLLKLPPSARFEAIKERSLCYNCLKTYTTSHACSSGTCLKCGKKHNTILHEYFSDSQNKSRNSATANVISSTSGRINSNTSSNCNQKSIEVIPDCNKNSCQCKNQTAYESVPEKMNSAEQSIERQSNVTSLSSSSTFTSLNQNTISILPTAEVIVYDSENKPIRCTALLDTGSNCQLISKELATRLKLAPILLDTTISSIGHGQTQSSVAHLLTIKSTDISWSTQQHCIVVEQISQPLPSVSIDVNKINIPKNILLADSKFSEMKQIDLLLGASVYASVLIPGQISMSDSTPIFQNSKLGWLVFGSFKDSTVVKSNPKLVSNFLMAKNDVSSQLEKFWKLEEVSNIVPVSKEDKFVENHYQSHTIRQEDGRFMVSLPRKDNFHLLGYSKLQAVKRFYSIEKRLANNADLKSQYVTFMEEYEQLGHMVKAPELPPDQKSYYLPHHCVLKPESTSTKLRVVFDASAKTSSGFSLNDVLHVGPTIQSELFEIVLRFRTHPIAFIADVSKMYRQIWIDPADREFHRILWRDDPSKPLLEYQLKTVTYGTAPAAFLSTRCLVELADLEANHDPELSRAIKRDFYVDDLLCGANSIEEAKNLSHNLLTTLEKGGFQLRKWLSNSTDVLDSFPPEFIETSEVKPVSEANDSATKALGLIWNAKSDNLSISSNIIETIQKTSFTKREFLSCIASIFDPLGLIAPVVISCKILFQELWLLKINWDDPLPSNTLNRWLEILQQLPTISEITIPRCVISKDNSTTIELHGFSDASLSAYGACIYIRSISENGIQTQLLCSKSRVAPIKALTVPKLELCAALLLSRLVNKVINALDLTFSKVLLWSDSKTVCDWLKAPAEKKNIFIAVRVTEIQESTSQFCWNHVRTTDNPADIISRGCKPQDLKTDSLWWHGPSWLSQSQDSWNSFTSNVVICQESKIALAISSEPSVLSNVFSSCSTHNKMIRTTAYVHRFLHNIRNSQNHLSGPLSVDELSDAEIRLIKIVQNEAFLPTIKLLQKEAELPSNNPLQQLSPFIDSDGIVRVGGRLNNANVSFNFKHQILIPNKHKFTKALIAATHCRLLHAGVQVTMASIRQNYWIPSTRRTIRSVLHSCVNCFRFNHNKVEQLMGQLPSTRVNIDHPFAKVSVDYAGPISLRLGGPKSRTFSKAYIALFVCMVTRAVHIEIVTELSTKAFLAALTRFTARRGYPNFVHSDNATNFIGASNELKELVQFLSSPENQKIIQDKASLFRIQWSFMPARAPSFGGLHENAVKNFKKIFRIVTHNVILNLEELFTLASQIEAILNSRPIVPLSEDPDDLAYLSPGHFLIGRPITALPCRQFKTTHIDHLSRWKRIQAMTQSFWDRWSQEYLVTLQKKQKWSSSSENLKVGTLVFLKDPGSLPSTWKLARITQVHPGLDNKVRVVTILTSTGSFKRPISNIVPIPLDDDNLNA